MEVNINENVPFLKRVKAKWGQCFQNACEPSKHQLRLNWCLVFLFGFYKDSGHTILLPTLHQYVTNPANVTCGNPGLGASETIYSLAAGMYNGGKIAGTLSVAILTPYVGFKFLFASGVFLQMIGFLAYGLSNNGWTIVLSRALVGYNSGIFIALPFAYFGKSVMEYSKLMKLTRKKGRKLKNQLIYLSGFITTSNCVLTLSLVMIIAQYPDVDQFRWTAWFQVIAGGIVLLLCALFRDSHQMCSKGCCASREKKANIRNDEFRSDRQQKRTPPMVIFTIGYLVLALYNTNSFLSVKEALTNPILSDYYGFTVELQSYFFMGVLLLIPLTCLTLLLLSYLHIDGRLFYLGLLLMSTMGLLLLGDWQTLGSADQCNNFSVSTNTSVTSSVEVHSFCDTQSCAPIELPTENNTQCSTSSQKLQALILESAYVTIYDPQERVESMSQQVWELSYCPLCSNYSTGTCLSFSIEAGVICVAEEDPETTSSREEVAIMYSIPEYQTQLCIALSEAANHELNDSCFSLPSALLKEINSLSFFDTLLSQQQCVAHSGPPFYCYWNRDSLIAEQNCPDCPALCRSTRKIPHFAQVFVAVGLLTIVAGGGVWVIGGMMVEVSPPPKLSLTTGISGFFGALARVFTPIWGNLVYVATGRHTVLPIMVMVLFQIPIYLGLALTWKQLKPNRNKSGGDDLDGEFNTAATTWTEGSPVEQSQLSRKDVECELKHDTEMEKTFHMYSVRLETEL